MPKPLPGTGSVKCGMKFGHWTVVSSAEPGWNNSRRWNCRCGRCGRVKRVAEYNLVSGKSTQCGGCANLHEDLTGRAFGKLLVLKRLVGSKLCGNIWLCRCKCGKQMRNSTHHLTGRGGQSCWDCKKNPALRLRPYEALLNGLRARAKHKGHHFSLSYEKFLNFTRTSACHYCGAAISFTEFNAGKNGRRQCCNLDRKDNRKGYVFSNLVACCCWECNFVKSNRFTYEQWYAMTECYRSGDIPRPVGGLFALTRSAALLSSKRPRK
jgi:hypothetical protein